MEGELRLDLREAATTKLASGTTAIVPGNPQASELIARINSADDSVRMPAITSGKYLTEGEKSTLARWISEGAEYQPHWAFISPVRPQPPALEGSGPRSTNAIDAFVAAKLKEQEWEFAPEADRPTLLRRLSFDLTGLPPSPAEVEAFVADPSSQAYEKQVDRLLASPRFGERMAMWWLDGARYADSNGYQNDFERFMWPWRDWVIDSFNSNLPFDQFTIEQLAGDLLPNATTSQKLATGFNRNHRINTEGGVIAEEWRIETVIDRVETTSTVWLGLTMGCARCHDHKYDPISQREFYRMFAFFNNVSETGIGEEKAINHPPTLSLPSPEDSKRLATFDAEIAKAELALGELLADSATPAAQDKWEREQAAVLLSAAKAWSVVSGELSAGAAAILTPQADGSFLVSGRESAKEVYTISAKMRAGSLAAIALDVVPIDATANGGFGRSGNGNIVLSEIQATLSSPQEPSLRPLKFARATADYSQLGWDIASAIDGNSATGWALDGHDPKNWIERHAVFVLETPVEVDASSSLAITLRCEALEHHNLGRFRLLVSGDPRAPMAGKNAVPLAVRDALATSASMRSPAQQEAVRSFYLAKISSSAHAAVERLRKARDEFVATLPTAMVMDELPSPRPAYILQRGQFDQPGEQVTAGVPSVLPPLPSGERVDRLGLARWLVQPSHPLTSRVQVNRLWEMLFGVGLVKSSDNFGIQAEYPSYPELLDWLATEYLRLGWNTKELLKTIVMSRTYQQTSAASSELYHRDPENRLLARGARLRLPAEMVRDNALAISGLLVEKQGGPSVRPYQPLGVWDDTAASNGNLVHYRNDHGPGLYRRSLYTIWKRTAPPPDMQMFDMPSREFCRVRRPRTNTPLQALTLLNSVTYTEASRVLAERMLRDGGPTPSERIAFGFRLATARMPTKLEADTLIAGLERYQRFYAAHSEESQRLIRVGESKPHSRLAASELAAYALIASEILNLDEVITKE